MARNSRMAFETEKKIWATNLKRAIENKGLTQVALAKRIEEGYQKGVYDEVISSASISNYCQGQDKIPPDRVPILCKALGISADYLFGLSETENPIEDIRHIIGRYPRFFDLVLHAKNESVAVCGKEIDLLMAIADYICFEKTDELVCIDNHGRCTTYKNMAEADKNRIFLDRTSDHYVMAEEIASYCKMKIITEALEYVRKYAQAHEWDLSDLEE